jgi:hypothetical protein
MVLGDSSIVGYAYSSVDSGWLGLYGGCTLVYQTLRKPVVPTLPVFAQLHFLSGIIGHFSGMPARCFTKMSSNQGFL